MTLTYFSLSVAVCNVSHTQQPIHLSPTSHNSLKPPLLFLYFGFLSRKSRSLVGKSVITPCAPNWKARSNSSSSLRTQRYVCKKKISNHNERFITYILLCKVYDKMKIIKQPLSRKWPNYNIMLLLNFSVITSIALIVCTSMFYILYLPELPHILIPNM